MFREKDLTLAGLAYKCGTSTKYLSKTLKYEKGKAFKAYITDLRMNYIIGKIEKNKRYRTVKINYLADECGFRDVHTFIRSFKIRTGEVPTKYIQNLSSENSEEA